MSSTSQQAGTGRDQSQTGTPLPIGTHLGDCDVIGVIGQGEYGIVYECVDRSSERKVAIKEYLPAMLADRGADGNVVVRSQQHQQSFHEGLQGFLTEARTLAAVDESALVKVLHFWEERGTAYMAMPLHAGRTLKDALRDSGRPSEAWLKGVLAPLLDALATLHAAKCYPCDATPDNIVLLADDSPLLFDFGLTRRILANVAKDETVVLKPGFAPIEKYVQDSSMPEGPWTDVYTVAASIHLAITGKAPTSPTSRIVADTMRPLRDVTHGYSERFLDGVDRGLAVRPEHRPQTIAEFRTALGIAMDAPETTRLGQPASPPPAAEPDELEATQPMKRGPLGPVAVHDRTRVRVLGDGTRITPPPSQLPQQPLPSPPSQAANRTGARPWKLVVSLLVIGLAAVGILVWIVGELRDTPPGSATTSVKSKATPPVPAAATTLNPVAPSPAAPVAETPTTVATPSPETHPSLRVPDAPASDQQAAAETGGVNGQSSPDSKPQTAGAAAPSGPAASGPAPAPLVPAGAAASAASVRPAPSSGKIQFSIKPWGEILIDGKSHGVSPPVKELSIPEGRHRIEIRNSTFPGYASDIVIKAGSNVAITHTFNAP